VAEDRRAHRPRHLRSLLPPTFAWIWFQCVSAGLQGFFLVFAVWIQVGLGFSPLAAGLTALALSAGSFALAAASVPLAQRHGRWILATGGR
jgi:hypothetical protein